MSNVELRNVQKSYGAVKVVHGISLDIPDGEFLVLVGPSGCGKSTLLRMIAGLENITGGEIAIDDRVINALAPRHRDIAMVFQSYALYPHMSVRKNMAFSLRLSKASAAETEKKVQDAAEILDLVPLLDRKPAQLSGGQRQRVAMGRAIVRNPKLFLFDEPLSNLDAKLRVQMRSEIKELHQRLKTTTVYVTHDQVEAMTMADRIVVMNGGNIEQVGTPMDLYDQPQTLFVAGFIGSPAMNFLVGTIDVQGQFKTEAGHKMQLPIEIVPSAQTQNVTLGIRPEDIQFQKADTCLGKIEVRVIEPTGPETLLTTSINGQSMVVLDRTRKQLKTGESVEVFVDSSKIHLFDHSNGQRLS